MLSRWPVAAAVSGGALVVAALFGDLLRGQPMGFGLAQGVALLLGIVLLMVAAGRRLPAIWRGLAIATLNVLVLLVAIELAAWIALQRMPAGRYAGSIRQRAWYDSQPWFRDYAREFGAVNNSFRFEPYLVWIGRPATGRYVTVDSLNRRTTTGTRCGPGAFRVDTYGGSTMWGVGAPDSLTIASYLQRLLAEQASGDVCVTNLGERAWVGTQELIQLERQLQRGRVPQVAVFYDGINDVINGWRYNDPGTHNNVDRIAQRINGTPGSDFLGALHVTRYLKARIARRLEANGRRVQGAPDDVTMLSGRVADVWSENCRMEAALGASYGFTALCLLQPAIAVGAKPLTADETESLSQMPAGQRDAFHASYDRIRARPPRGGVFADLSGAFDSISTPLYLDWYHVLPPGNEVIAQRIARIITALPGFPARGARPGRRS